MSIILPPESYKIREDFRQNEKVVYDHKDAVEQVVWQPHVYDVAKFLAEHFGCTKIIDVGCGNGNKLIPFFDKYEVVGVDYGSNIELCRELHKQKGTWITQDLEQGLHIPRYECGNTIIICSDVIEHLLDPSKMIFRLRSLASVAPAVILSTPNRPEGRDRPAHKYHVREWSIKELKKYLIASKIIAPWWGITKSNSKESSAWNTSLTVISRFSTPELPVEWAQRIIWPKVFGIGLSRTGTSSLTGSLRAFDFYLNHYPTDITTCEFLFGGKYKLPILYEYDGVSDIQASVYYPQFDREYPGSKFILTTRDEQSWLDSMYRTFQVKEINHKILNSYKNLFRVAMYGTAAWNKDRLLHVYRTHVKNCREYFKDRPDDFLEIDICGGEGWEKLNSFLTQKHSTLFPHLNRLRGGGR